MPVDSRTVRPQVWRDLNSCNLYLAFFSKQLPSKLPPSHLTVASVSSLAHRLVGFRKPDKPISIYLALHPSVTVSIHSGRSRRRKVQ